MRLTIWGWGPQQGRVGVGYPEATLSQGTSSVIAARSCDTGNRWRCWTDIPSVAFCTRFRVAVPASRTGYEEAPQWSLSGLSVSQKTSVSLSRKWNKVLWKWINAASIQTFRNSFQVKKKNNCMFVACSNHIWTWGIYKAVMGEQSPDWAFVMCPARRSVLSLLLPTTTR